MGQNVRGQVEMSMFLLTRVPFRVPLSRTQVSETAMHRLFGAFCLHVRTFPLNHSKFKF